MASIILGSIGGSIGSKFAGSFGGAIGQFLGGAVGNFIDSKLFPSHQRINTSGARLKNLSIQSSAYGSMIPIIYGTVRLAGNIIWAQTIHENKQIKTFNYKAGKGAKISRSHAEYNYSATFAISICEGPIDELIKIWANNKLLDLSCYTIRIYKGTEDQTPDSIIEATQGIGQAPAYRGQAYIVFEEFPLIEFGNQIPNFTFEVKKNNIIPQQETISELIESVVIIPGSGEFVYDTVPHVKIEGNFAGDKWSQCGHSVSLNQHNVYSKANAVISIDQLKQTLPKTKWVAPVVNWFASSLNTSECKILPGVEYNEGAITKPTLWKVDKFDRLTAKQITKIDGHPIYGGTPSDQSILNFLKHLKACAYNVMFYPMLMIDNTSKPWRGHLTGEPQTISRFFSGENGYNKFILHYAKLAKDYIDAFVIGSELIGLTKIRDKNNEFPAVNELIKLASLVRKVLGKKVIITYAADWSEYHHTDGGWYNLDSLWAAEDIDVIGIDAYFPLSSKANSIYNIEEVERGWKVDEGYDYYYEGDKQSKKAPLHPAYAWKNISWWWENHHYNPDGKKTAWQPKSKKIWFTEYGFPSVDCCTNQPNVFYDASSQESALPYLSKGTPDFKAQRMAIIATEKAWKNSPMVERKFLWAWDARPYPYWPALTKIWSDGNNWLTGHWVQGKLGNSELGAVVYDLCKRAGLRDEEIECCALNDTIEGIVFDQQSSIRSNLELLQQIYFFAVVEINKKIEFAYKSNKQLVHIASKDLMPFITERNETVLKITRTEDSELPNNINLNFINIEQNYHIGNQHITRNNINYGQKHSLDIPICMTANEAQNIVEKLLYNSCIEKFRYNFSLTVKHANLTPGTLVQVWYYNARHNIRITDVHFGKNFTLKVSGVAEDPDINNANRIFVRSNDVKITEPIAQTYIEILDLPTLPFDDYTLQGYVLIAAASLSKNWKGASIFLSHVYTSGYELALQINKQATIGSVLEKLPSSNTAYIDNKNNIIVNLISGKLHNVDKSQLLNGANMALIGNEIIHFQNAKLIAPFKYQLSGLLRGRQSTEREVNNHTAGDRFVLLDENLERVELPANHIGKKVFLKAVSNGKTLGEVNVKEFTYAANCLKPFSPVHLKAKKTADGIQISWFRRTRLNGEMLDNIEVPLGEEKESYICELKDQNGKLIKIIETSNSKLFISNDTLKFNLNSVGITQLSSTIGRGFESVINLK